MSKKNQNNRYGRFSAVTEVTNPLKFFALALLIVEAIIAVLSAHATDTLLYTLAYLATFMFVLVIIMVVLIIAKWPDVLTATRPNQLASSANKINVKVRAIEVRKKQKTVLLKEHGDINKIISEAVIPTKQIIVRQKRLND